MIETKQTKQETRNKNNWSVSNELRGFSDKYVHMRNDRITTRKQIQM